MDWRSASGDEPAVAATDGGNSATGNRNAQLNRVNVGDNLNVTQIEHQHNYPAPSQPQPVSSSLHQIPSPPGDFTGRKSELNELLDKLERESVVISGMHGAGGIGKSALAFRLTEHLAPRYPDAQIYIDLKGTSQEPVPVAEAMAHVIRAWDVEAAVPEGEAALQALYRSSLHEKKALLLFDNAVDRWQVEPLIPPSSCLMLVTSRTHFPLPGCYSRDLDKMEPQDARDLVMKIAARLSQAEAENLSKACGYMPQALRTAAGSLVESPNISPAEFLKRLEKSKYRLDLVEGVFDVSYELMEQDMQRLWRLLGVFPGTFDDAGAAAVWEMTEREAQDALAKLLRRSMLDWDAKTSRYKLHDLARDFAQSKFAEGETETASSRHAVYYADMAGKANGALLQGGESYLLGLGMHDRERHNIEAGCKWAQAWWEKRHEAARLCVSYALKCPNILSLRLHPQEYIDWMDAALRSARRLRDRRGEGVALANQGHACRCLGDYTRAIELHKQALVIFRETGDRRAEGRVLGNLGLTYSSIGKNERAIVLHKQSFEIAREVGDRSGEGDALCSLGICYDSAGESEHAIELYGLALAIARETGDRKSESMTLNNLGIACRSLGQNERAIELIEQALAISSESSDRGSEGIARANLGNACDCIKDFKRAVKFYQQALVIFREVGDRSSEGRVLFNESLALQSLGRREEALMSARAALEVLDQLGVPEAENAQKLVAELEEGS